MHHAVKTPISEVPKLIAVWSYELNKGIDPSQIGKYSGDKYWWEHTTLDGRKHVWQARTKSLLTSKSEFGCTRCTHTSHIKKSDYIFDIRPELLQYFDTAKNTNVDSSTLREKSGIKIWWTHTTAEGIEHSWQMACIKVTDGKWCTICQEKDRLANSFAHKEPELLQFWDYTKNTISPDSIASGSNKVVWWKHIAEDGVLHAWESRVDCVVAAKGCTICSGSRVIKETSMGTKRPDLMAWWDFKKNKKDPFTIGEFSHYKAYWVHTTETGTVHEWRAEVGSRAKGYGCPMCSGCKTSYEDSFGACHKELLKEWDYSKNTVSPYKIKAKSSKEMWWVHTSEEGHVHSWKTQVSARVRGNGCPYCAGRRVSRDNSFGTKEPELLAEWDYSKNELDPFAISVTDERPVWWAHTNEKGVKHEWQCSTSHRYKARMCPRCNGAGFSIVEVLILKELEMFFKVKHQAIFEELGNKKKVDYYIEELGLVIEYDGFWWHNSEEQLKTDRKYTKLLEKSGYTVIRLRQEPLEKIAKNDISITKPAQVKETVNKLLTAIEKLPDYSGKGFAEYIEQAKLSKKQEVEKFLNRPITMYY